MPRLSEDMEGVHDELEGCEAAGRGGPGLANRGMNQQAVSAVGRGSVMLPTRCTAIEAMLGTAASGIT